MMMTMMRRRLACCARHGQISLDFDEPTERIMTYDGLESCILGNHSYENESGTSRGDEYPTDSIDDNSSCCSSKETSGSFSTWMTAKRDDGGLDDCELLKNDPRHFCVKENPSDYAVRFSDVEAMKETFAKLLLGEDITGGRKGITSALALSNAITNLAASVFGELWKLEPLSEEKKSRWRREMDWFLSPMSYMVELVPAKQNGADGCTLEIMTPKTRADVHMYLPALQKLDSMLIEVLDSMVKTEFWYAEGGSRIEGKSSSGRQSKRWWLPSPHLPTNGLSDTQGKKLLYQGQVVHQIFKAAKSINENILLKMPVPTVIKDALPKSGKESLGEELYRVLTSESITAEELLISLNLKSEHHALQAINRLEIAVCAWREKITEQANDKSPVRTSWSFTKDPLSDLDKRELLLDRAEFLLQLLKTRYPNLPQTFVGATKVQYGKDVGLSILEAYSRVLANLALSILSRIAEIFQEDALSNPTSPLETNCLSGLNPFKILETPVTSTSPSKRHSLIDQMKRDGHFFYSSDGNDSESGNSEARMNSLVPKVSRSRVWCIGRKGCSSTSPRNSPCDFHL